MTDIVSAQQVFDDIVAYIKTQGGPAQNWYAGIATDAEERLFSDHNVSKKNGWWIYLPCKNSTNARNVEKALLEYGCVGGGGGGNSTTKKVYAYLKTSSTEP